jgi:hypothetical protein
LDPTSIFSKILGKNIREDQGDFYSSYSKISLVHTYVRR